MAENENMEVTNQGTTEIPTTQVEEGSNQNYIDVINNLKANSVSKDSYNKLLKENKDLLDSLVNGNGEVSTEPAPAEEKPTLSQLREELFTPKKELTDLEYVTKALELRERVLEETGEDCFVGASHSYTPEADDYAKAEKCAKVFKECVDIANGSNAAFIAALQDRTNEVVIPSSKNKNNIKR